METNNKYLPIGTVVTLNGGTKRLMITGFAGIDGTDEKKVWDYSGCLFPEGIVEIGQAALFNHSQIEKIEYMGYIDDEEKEFKERLKEMNL